ncbi:Urease accessory protein UreD [Trichormus variabilis ATCC 29413]|uniref:Urease accessory protein UreD n=2 Tax=Anabaena variabilis TaxID=264691 RepID=URED_TRIV2|nr:MULTISPECIES: urease accessory protein UreD [Nostocaceae]Q3M708.1 RecName: Full=Urease accessory protein UreD [Trichormus variabilis ATCC 29413]ABA23228.1 Urease accessory protein UreD [Trichormus variabilis ATCC 29413]MBC1212787.1 urease accessory protein UreD [Trichormus variabilis ARAD]MBC1254799.1 urease accessory protein UreD [Trichormus variabilis V5]MBC1266161.1 urease accessory protein UreD [Trichormus variabilis FSR]MBC1301439.1 urease accessory protein UreD [Trichormus variabilis
MAFNSQPIEGWHGKLDLVYADRSNSTQLIYNHQQAPLKVQRPFYPEGEKVCHSVILHTAGGVVGGDRLSYNLHLQPNAQALITTAAAGKIYRSEGLQARQTIDIKIDAGACLEWLPQETILFNGAIYRQDLRVELATGANFLGWEITRFGRSARGEKFYQGEWRSHTEIWRQGVPLWIDRQWLPGNEAVFHSPHGLAGQPIVGSLVWLGSAVSTEIIAKARNLGNTQGEKGVTSLENGFLCRYRGASTSEVRNWFTDVWQLLRVEFFSRSKCTPRVWQT